MSAGAKGRAKEARRKEKTKRKAAKRALYQSYAESGKGKSKRSKLVARRTRSSPNKHQHLILNCGNAGCDKCYPRKEAA